MGGTSTRAQSMRFSFIASWILLLAGVVPASASVSDLERQRSLFRDVFPAVERGNWHAVETLPDEDRRLLQAYVLWPDLRATWLKANIKTAGSAEIESFLTRYAALKPARELRYRYALHQARSGKLSGYLKIYEQFYQGQNIASLDCLALQAELDAGRTQRVDARALELWMVGKSQVGECDPVFAYLKKAQGLGLLEYRRRFALAIEAREFSLARWLGKSIDPQHVDIAAQWQQAQSNPEDFLRRKRRVADNPTLRAQLVYAAEQLTYRDPVIATTAWDVVKHRYSFSTAQKLKTAQHIALWMARDNLPGAYQALARLPDAAQSDEVLRWRVRTLLRTQNWPGVLEDIERMSQQERVSEEWRYWQAVALRNLQRETIAGPIFGTLAKERSYYGFLAADLLKKSYALDHAELQTNETVIAAIAARPDIVRARELFYVGQDGRGRSEWETITTYFSDEEKMQRRHSRRPAGDGIREPYRQWRVSASTTTFRLRYPLPWKQEFETHRHAKARISATWAYGVARSESLFMRDVRSHAQEPVGLMQLMPKTGRAGCEGRTPAALVRPGDTAHRSRISNIRLGTSYLGHDGGTLWRQPGTGHSGL